MRALFLLLLLVLSGWVRCQEGTLDTASISSEDALVLKNLKNKVAQYINTQPDSAFYFSRKMKALALERKYPKGVSEAYYLIGQCFKRIQKTDSAIHYFKTSLAHSQNIHDSHGEARAYNSLCRTYYLTGDMDASIEACQMAIEISKELEESIPIIFADSHTALGTAYARQNNLEEAIKAFLTVDSIHKAIPLRPDVIAAAYQNLGNIYLELEDYDTSELYCLKANQEFMKLGPAANYYLNTTNVYLGQVYFYKDELKKADSLLTLCYTFFSEINDERTTGEVSTYLGQLKLKESNFKEAETYFKESFNLHKKNNRSYEASLNALELAKVALKKDSPEQAIGFLEEVTQLNLSSNNSQVSQDANELFAISYAASNNYRKAFEYQQKATALKDSIQNVQSAEKIKEIEAQYQTESRDREIHLLTSKNELVEQQKNNQRNIFIAGLAFTSLLGLFFFFQYRSRQKTNKKLQEIDKAKSTFFANISHEFRTPLTLIRGPIEDQLDQKDTTPNERRNLLIAKANSQRLELLVEQLLALSKLESGDIKLQVQPGNLGQFIRVQIEAFSYLAQEKNLKINYTENELAESQWFDRDAFGKILFNLLGNAIKYTSENGDIEINVRQINSLLHLKISNTGSYLSPEQQQKIFTRFYQTHPENPGTGIGLALTKELTELHKGHISVRSKREGLTVFSLEVPVDKSAFDVTEILSERLHEEENPNYTESVVMENNLAQPNDAPIILIVEDNDELRNYIKSLFEGTYEIHVSKDGANGFEMALKLIPDIVVSDVMMPVEDGFSLTAKLKQHSLTSHIPVILLTAKSETHDQLTGIEIGADAYITKPFGSKILKATVHNLIENRRKLQKRFAQEVILKPKEIAISNADEEFLEALQKVLDEYLTQSDFSAETFSKKMHVSRMQLHRKLKALTGQSTSEFLRSQRLKLAITLLQSNKAPISEIAYAVGFNDPSYFTRSFKQEFGCPPSDFVA